MGLMGACLLEVLLVVALRAVVTRKVDIRLPGKGNSTSHGARPVQLIITMITWIRTSRLSIQTSWVAKALQRKSWARRWTSHGNVAHIRQSRPNSDLGFQIKYFLAMTYTTQHVLYQ